MDLVSCAAVSCLEGLIAYKGDIFQGLNADDTQHTSLTRYKVILSVFILQYLTLKWYRIFVYPWYFSPLRHLPTPKVSHL
jgi:hypothetical protein